MSKKPMIHPLQWWRRPLFCLLGLHKMRTHPSAWYWLYCQQCGGERNLLP